MKHFSRLLKKSAFCLGYFFCCLQSAYGDDTEVFLAEENTTSVKPNIMFIIDTSGSMLFDVDSGSSVAYDDFPNNRLQIVNDVINELLLDLNDVNAGLMRFGYGGKGAAVLMPVKDLDAEASPSIYSRLTEEGDDGHQSGSVSYLSEDYLQLYGDRTSALRFSNLNVPQGATITSATISLTAREDNDYITDTYQITAEKSAFPAELATSGSDITSRTPTTAQVSWLTGQWKGNQVYSTTNLQSIVQELVNQSDWCGGQDMLFMLKKTSGDSNSEKTAFTADGMYSTNGGTYADLKLFPEIRIEYEKNLPAGTNVTGCYTKTISSQVNQSSGDFELAENNTSSALEFYKEGTHQDQKFALVFPSVKLPNGVDIQDAYIAFTAADDEVANGETKIAIVNDSFASTDDSVLSLASTALISASNWSLPNFVKDDLHFTDSVGSIVESVVGLSDWEYKNNLVFVFEGVSGKHKAYSFEGEQGKAPILRVTYKGYKDAYNKVKFSHRDALMTAADNLIAMGGTPIAHTLAEAAQYFKGGSVEFGKTRDSVATNRVSHSSSYTGGSHSLPDGCNAENLNDDKCKSISISSTPVYTAPDFESCQSNNIVYLTDGAGSNYSDMSATSDIYNSWTGNTCSSNDDCSEKIASYLAGESTTSSGDYIDLSNVVLGDQSINMHMIGFGEAADETLMTNMASTNGGYYQASDKRALLSVLKTINMNITANNTSFSTAGVTINQSNRLTHRDELYFSLFTPESKNVWPGNLKRYRLSNGIIYDKNGDIAVDPTTSKFVSSAQSFWSSTEDGDDVEEGGAASKLTTGRNLYTNNNSLTLTKVSRGTLTSSLVGATTNDDRKMTVDWALGIDTDDPSYSVTAPAAAGARRAMSDPLHSQPTIVSYANGTSLVFVGTNDGFLHAINADKTAGTEAWAFIPKELLRNLNDIRKSTSSNRIYGLDGPITFHLNDTNSNGLIDSDEKAMLYVGMRRGGYSYYALDISDSTKPSLDFIISNTADDAVTAGYSQLGQTWSPPVIGKMNLSGVNDDKAVMIFGGGYDTNQDDNNPSTKGNMVYIADAYTGAKLWTSAEVQGVTLPVPDGADARTGDVTSMSSVPAQITAFDLSGDGYIDHFYASDTKAQVFRFDVNNAGSNSSIVGGRIASLQGTGTDYNNRRFYYPTDVSKINLSSGNFLSVSVGSGFRAHPLDTDIDDHFYMIKDKGVLDGNGVFDIDLTVDQLTNVTNRLGDSNSDGTSDAQAEIENDGDLGWYITFSNSGEKVIEKSITFNNAVIFTTYTPESAANSCSAVAGKSRIYGMRISDGNPFVDIDDIDNLEASDRYQDLVAPGIAPAPKVIIETTSSGVENSLCIGLQCNLSDFLPDTSKGILGYQWKNAKDE